MKLKFKNQDFQTDAVNAVCDLFLGQEKRHSSFEISKNATNLLLQNEFGIGNVKLISNDRILENMNKIQKRNNLPYTDDLANNQFCIEMETGTGKTLVYIKTIYELFKHYGFTKFIILVPSVAIRQNIIGTFKSFDKQLSELYGFTPNSFEYDSKKLPKVTQFIEDQHPQVMIMTLASFNSEDKILNQAQREDLFNNIPFIEAIGKTNPIIIMDEPQEGMDTDNSIKQIAKLNPLIKLRYSATHKVIKNLNSTNKCNF